MSTLAEAAALSEALRTMVKKNQWRRHQKGRLVALSVHDLFAASFSLSARASSCEITPFVLDNVKWLRKHECVGQFIQTDGLD